MAEQKHSKAKARIIFSEADWYKLVPATGAWGGVSPQKEIIVDFYVDNRRNPEYMDIEAEKDGKITKEERTPSSESIDRILQFGVVMRPDIARSIGQFLIDKANEVFEKAEKE